MASILGVNIFSDIFFVAFKFPNLFRRIFAEGAFVQAFLPSFIASRNKSLFSIAIFLRFLGIILFISIVVTLFAPLFTKLLAFGFDEKTIEVASTFVAINFYYLALIFIVTFFASLLQYKEHFSTTAFSTSLLNLSLIGALLIAQHSQKIDIVYALSYAVLIGGVLQVLLHLVVASNKSLLKFLIGGFKHLNAKKSKITHDVKRFNKQFIPAIFGNSSAQLSAFLDTWLASFLASGAISYLYYANRIFQLPLAIFAIATATALFPSVAKAIKAKDERRALSVMKKSFWMLSFLLSFSLVGGIMLSDEIIWLLFERGAFERADTLNTSMVLMMYMIGLLPFGLAKIFSMWLYSNHQQLLSAKIAGISFVVNIALSLALIIPLKAMGLALASSISGFVLLALTIRAFGTKAFFAIIWDKKGLLLLLLLGIEVALLMLFKNFYTIG